MKSGVKDDKTKPSIWQGIVRAFPRALWAVAEVSAFGARKYSWDNWKSVKDGFSRYKDAQFRHALKREMGEDIDEESKYLHLAHEAWNALATLELYLREQKDVEGNAGNPSEAAP